jgi:AcrR family transcriptional regulator
MAAGNEQAVKRRRWGDKRALSDQDEASRLLLSAASRCIEARGDINIAMGDVADEAGVTRSTLYRYFPSRIELVTALLLSRAEGFVAASVASLPDADSARKSLSAMILHPIERARNSALSIALFAPESQGLAVSVEMESDAVFEIAMRHYGTVLRLWQESGQLHSDLEIATIVRWISALALVLLSSPWRDMTTEERRNFVDTYVARALLTS